jgi:hypothetical protein
MTANVGRAQPEREISALVCIWQGLPADIPKHSGSLGAYPAVAGVPVP